jgi:hypothetical protein
MTTVKGKEGLYNKRVIKIFSFNDGNTATHSRILEKIGTYHTGTEIPKTNDWNPSNDQGE